jgi:hypothetical protein
MSGALSSIGSNWISFLYIYLFFYLFSPLFPPPFIQLYIHTQHFLYYYSLFLFFSFLTTSQGRVALPLTEENQSWAGFTSSSRRIKSSAVCSSIRTRTISNTMASLEVLNLLVYFKRKKKESLEVWWSQGFPFLFERLFSNFSQHLDSIWRYKCIYRSFWYIFSGFIRKNRYYSLKNAVCWKHTFVYFSPYRTVQPWAPIQFV